MNAWTIILFAPSYLGFNERNCFIIGSLVLPFVKSATIFSSLTLNVLR